MALPGGKTRLVYHPQADLARIKTPDRPQSCEMIAGAFQGPALP